MAEAAVQSGHLALEEQDLLDIPESHPGIETGVGAGADDFDFQLGDADDADPNVAQTSLDVPPAERAESEIGYDDEETVQEADNGHLNVFSPEHPDALDPTNGDENNIISYGVDVAVTMGGDTTTQPGLGEVADQLLSSDRAQDLPGFDDIPGGFDYKSEVAGVGQLNEADEQDFDLENDGLDSPDEQEASAAADDDSSHDTDEASEHDGGSQHFTAHQPDIKVIYNNTEYELCARENNDDPETYFFAGIAELDYPISGLLACLREVISAEIDPGHEIVLRINQLGLEFPENSAHAFLGKNTLRNILDLYQQLQKNDGVSDYAEPVLDLLTRPNCARRLGQLLNGAKSGLGLSHFLNDRAESDHSDESSPVEDEADDAAGSSRFENLGNDQDTGSQDLDPEDISEQYGDNKGEDISDMFGENVQATEVAKVDFGPAQNEANLAAASVSFAFEDDAGNDDENYDGDITAEAADEVDDFADMLNDTIDDEQTGDAAFDRSEAIPDQAADNFNIADETFHVDDDDDITVGFVDQANETQRGTDSAPTGNESRFLYFPREHGKKRKHEDDLEGFDTETGVSLIEPPSKISCLSPLLSTLPVPTPTRTTGSVSLDDDIIDYDDDDIIDYDDDDGIEFISAAHYEGRQSLTPSTLRSLDTVVPAQACAFDDGDTPGSTICNSFGISVASPVASELASLPQPDQSVPQDHDEVEVKKQCGVEFDLPEILRGSDLVADALHGVALRETISEHVQPVGMMSLPSYTPSSTQALLELHGTSFLKNRIAPLPSRQDSGLSYIFSPTANTDWPSFEGYDGLNQPNKSGHSSGQKSITADVAGAGPDPTESPSKGLPSQPTSSTQTIHGDEIGYENPEGFDLDFDVDAPVTEGIAQQHLDEIDWDNDGQHDAVKDKIDAVASANQVSSNGSAKRTRQADEIGSQADESDVKRRKT